MKKETAIIVVDHGSLREKANDLLWEVTDLLKKSATEFIVEGAHMELADPSIDDIVEKVVKMGAKKIIIHPYMLAPGRHATEDIPRMAKKAVQKHSSIELLVTKPLGLDQEIINLILKRCAEVT